MMQGSLAWNWRTDILCFHPLFYLSALRSSITSRASRSLKSPCYCFPLSLSLVLNFFIIVALNGAADWSISNILSWHLKSRLRLEGWIPVIEGETFLWHATQNMSRRMGDKGVLGRGCQQKWISAREDTTQAAVQWFSTSWHLFTTTTFQTELCMTFIAGVMHSSEPHFSGLWRLFQARVKHVIPVLT